MIDDQCPGCIALTDPLLVEQTDAGPQGIYHCRNCGLAWVSLHGIGRYHGVIWRQPAALGLDSPEVGQ